MFPRYFFVTEFNNFKMIVLFFGWIFNIMHQQGNAHNLNAFDKYIEILNFLPCIIDMIPFKFC